MIKIGSVFDNRYLILQELGEGGMGKVYKARQVDIDREVALKFLKEIHDEESKERFFREFKVLSDLKHQHVMTVYGMALYDEVCPYAICELLEGKSLRQYLQETGHLSWEQAVEIAIQIADALDFAHKAGIIHRDLKPENIVLVDKPRVNFVKLIDFGLSKLLTSENEKLTVTGQLIGSPMYMSPEQIRQSADHLSDIYSFGCIIFEMLSGEYLFPSDAPVAAIYLHSTERATERISAVKGELPASLVRLILDMLAKDPGARVQSAAEVSRRLIQIKETPGAMLDSQAKNLKSSKQGQQNILAIMIGAIALLAIIMFAFQNSMKLAFRNPKASSDVMPVHSLRRRILELDQEISRDHGRSVEYATLHGFSTVPKQTTDRFTELLNRAKSMEKEAVNVNDKFDVYYLEHQCYSEMQETAMRIELLEKCLQLVHLNKRKSYQEEPGLLCTLASLYAVDSKNYKIASRYCEEAASIRKSQLERANSGHYLDKISKLSLNAPAESLRSLHDTVAKIYLWNGDYKRVLEESKALSDDEENSYPQTAPGNATLCHVIMYADALVKLGRKDEAKKHVERVLSKVNKIGEIPESDKYPDRQQAVACDILNVYNTGIQWFNANGMPDQVNKYQKLANEFGSYYHLKFDPKSSGNARAKGVSGKG